MNCRWFQLLTFIATNGHFFPFRQPCPNFNIIMPFIATRRVISPLFLTSFQEYFASRHKTFTAKPYNGLRKTRQQEIL